MLERESRTATQLYYGLQLPDQLLQIVVDLNANLGRFELLKHRLIFQFESYSLAKDGELLMSSFDGFNFVAFVEYDTGVFEAVYYCDNPPVDAVEEAMKSVAFECFFDADNNGRYLTQILLPDEFALLSAMSRQLCEFVTLSRKGRIVFTTDALGHMAKPIEDAIKKQGVELIRASKGGVAICSQTMGLEFERVHSMLASLFVTLDGFGTCITSVELDLPEK